MVVEGRVSGGWEEWCPKAEPDPLHRLKWKEEHYPALISHSLVPFSNLSVGQTSS